MSGFEAVLPFVAAAGIASGTALSAASSISQGEAANSAAKAQAQQEEAAAKQAGAIAQRDALSARRETDIKLSKARAVAAASGAGADDPTVLDLSSAIDAAGEYDVAAALYEGSARNTAYTNRARMTRYSGQQEQTAGAVRAASTVLNTASSMAMKYA